MECNNNEVLNKKFLRRTWTAEEDRKLVNFVKVHGENKWKQLVEETGLDRCKQSCRVRWKSYLKPGITRDDFNEDENDLIMRLHNLLGNRWCLIAKRLPGRTDTQLKNQWNKALAKQNLTTAELNIKMNQRFYSTNNNCNTFAIPSSSSKHILTLNENDEDILYFSNIFMD